ncbi:hypothetical protein BO86DRAFT_13363 [Aspergillus japonicus CBS 114.51]|uniref:Uncharacterized protein n=1 Tax=Aspergillus japonicus CBS 114.51 TaxID=1448312 RepID=A0A8T8X7P3_ASPJA|nr:hypothetical protein BO86DRAFT_13363 [Aspergillus japonicus CBS 114.51]RAH84136.1 hypothetical protein BO86DRAFT_13363 [Aspergillus japonicus CBS 114.51]
MQSLDLAHILRCNTTLGHRLVIACTMIDVVVVVVSLNRSPLGLELGEDLTFTLYFGGPGSCDAKKGYLTSTQKREEFTADALS